MAEVSRKRIGTHDGTFHCDEALACFMLKKTKTFKDADIVRTRDPKILDTLDIVVDVGAVYDAEKLRFDHHQNSFTGTLDDKHTTKLSSAGLVYKHFGREIIKNELQIDDEQTETVFQKVYESFVESIDGIDNGISQYDASGAPKYKIRTDLSSRVGGLNPWWNDTDVKIDERFQKAVQLTGQEFLDSVNYFGKAWLPAKELVVKAIENRFSVHSSGEIIQLDQFCPWKDYLFELEPKLNVQVPIKYVLFTDQSKTWRVQCVPENPSSFNNRKSLLWKGLRDEELSNASGIPGGVFVHAGGFIGGNATHEGALQMAVKSLQAE